MKKKSQDINKPVNIPFPKIDANKKAPTNYGKDGFISPPGYFNSKKIK